MPQGSICTSALFSPHHDIIYDMRSLNRGTQIKGSPSPLWEVQWALTHSQHILTELFFFTFFFFTGERNTFKAIIFCLDEHEIHPLVIIELREAFKEVAQCTIKDLHTSPQTAPGFYLCRIHSSHMVGCKEPHASHLSK